MKRLMAVLAAVFTLFGVMLAAAGTLAEVPKAVVAADYLRPAVRFLKFLPQAMEVAQQDPTLEYYGDGPVDAGSGRRP